MEVGYNSLKRATPETMRGLFRAVDVAVGLYGRRAKENRRLRITARVAAPKSNPVNIATLSRSKRVLNLTAHGGP